MLNEFTYCARLYYLEHVQREFEDNADTVEGRSRHRRVDAVTGSAPEPAEPSDPPKPGWTRSTSVTLSAPTLGAIARIDVLETNGRQAVPVDFKRGRKPDLPEGAYEPERVQICLQGLILRENGYDCDHGEIFFVESRTRVRIAFDDELTARTLALMDEARAVARRTEMPPPLVDSPKCPRCSLVGICLPDEVNFLVRSPSPAGVRRLLPARDDAAPLYLQTQGLSAGKDGEVIRIRQRGEAVRDVRLVDVSQVNVFGSVQLSTPLINELLRRDIPIGFFSYGGWLSGFAVGTGNKNIDLRRRQFAIAGAEAESLHLARRFVRGKILNARTLLRRNHRSLPAQVLKEMARLAFAASRARDLSTLLGIEGAAARSYFARFGEMLRGDGESDLAAFDFDGRNRRPPRDPVNCLLSFLYALLCKDLVITVRAVGFDPFLGFHHQPRYGRPALALDLMVEFRPLIADSVVLQVVNTGEIKRGDFVMRAGACSLTDSGRRRAIQAYERRMDSTITHPLFGYSASYRRVLDVQARLLARALSGEIPEYPIFRTR
jgi:CRISPR-associated protein Cas1